MKLKVDQLEMYFGDRLIQKNISFEVSSGTIFAIMGGSGCGKSTLLKHMIGLLQPASGSVSYDGVSLWDETRDEDERSKIQSQFGVLFQSAALWSSMTVLENVLLPMQKQGKYSPLQQIERAKEILSWVGLLDFINFYPSDLSGGMKKRVGLARAVGADPTVLFLDEPSAGLDPVTSYRLDELILAIRDRTQAAILLVSHELPSLFKVADDGIFLDAESKQPIGQGSPEQLLKESKNPRVHAFLTRTDYKKEVPLLVSPQEISTASSASGATHAVAVLSTAQTPSQQEDSTL